jgi:hypothetical protein|tara:strand:- start:1085 stop:1843 length:759 start_codon:yes stop_codon:yes gene_type:complete
MISPIKEVAAYRCVEYLKEIIPAESVVDTFLFYAGQLEFDLAQANRLLRCHTNRYVIYEFWYCMQEDPDRVAELAKYFRDSTDPISYTFLQKSWAGLKDHYVRAAIFFLLNVSSEEGYVSSGKLNLQQYSPIMLNRIKQCSFENMRINFYKDEEFFVGTSYVEKPEYLLFPMGKFNYNLFEEGKSYGYEMTPVSHTGTKLSIDELKHNTLVLYKYHKEILKLYDGYNITMINKYGKVTESSDHCEDLVIANF